MNKILSSLALCSFVLAMPAHAVKNVDDCIISIVSAANSFKNQGLKDKALLDAIGSQCQYDLWNAPLIGLLKEFKRINHTIGIDLIARAIAADNRALTERALTEIVNNPALQDLRPTVARFYYLLNEYSLQGVDENSYGFSLQDYFDYLPKRIWHCNRGNAFTLSLNDLRLNSLYGIENLPKIMNMQLSDIFSLHLIGNQFDQLPIAELKKLVNLKSLELIANRITSIPAGSFEGFTHLESLDLRSNQITQLQEGAFEGLCALQFLSLSTNKIIDIHPKVLQGLDLLVWLWLDNNNLVKVPTSALQCLKNLQTFLICDNKITEIEEGSFKGLVSLKDLNIMRNPMSEIPLAPFGELMNVEELYLGDTQATLSKIDLESFKGMPKLRYLKLLNSNLNEENKTALHAALPKVQIEFQEVEPYMISPI